MESSLSPLARSNTSERGTTDDVSEEVGSQSAQPNQPLRSDHEQNFLVKDVFLSHSSKQKNFIRQLFRNLENENVSCFFDEDRHESLPVGRIFPPRIFHAIRTCQIAVLLLSMDFLESKWPMMELSAFVDRKFVQPSTNPNLVILPLFFGISPTVLKNFDADNERWRQFNEITPDQRAQWLRNLKQLRSINGLIFKTDDDEVKFRDEIAEAIWQFRTPPARYDYPRLQGELRMCQEVTSLFDNVRLNERRIRIAGLYGIAGSGKTTLGKAFCNMKLNSFQGKVCHLEFGRGDSLERTKLALRYLTNCHQSCLQKLTSQNEAQIEFKRRVEGEKVLLVLDNITENSMGEVNYYVEADYGEDSCILLTARGKGLLVNHFELERSMPVPKLVEDEAIQILLERTSLGQSMLEEDRNIALQCATRCLFQDVSGTDSTFHPLALKAFGTHLFAKYGSSLSNWYAEIEEMGNRPGAGLGDVMAVQSKSFENMRREYRTIFLLLSVYMVPNISTHKVTEWLAISCNKEISFIKEAVQDLCKEAFVEAIGTEICTHDLYTEFAQSKVDEMGRWLWWKEDPRSTRGLISSEHNAGFELARLERCRHRRPSQVDTRDLQNLLVLQLVNVQNMSNLDLGGMSRLRSITVQKCRDLKAIQGMEKLQHLAWLQIGEVNPEFEIPELSKLEALQHLEINITTEIEAANELGDLTPCIFLREIKVWCTSLSNFPTLNGLPYLEKVEFKASDKMEGFINCNDCVELQSFQLESYGPMTCTVGLDGCNISFTTRFEAT